MWRDWHVINCYSAPAVLGLDLFGFQHSEEVLEIGYDHTLLNSFHFSVIISSMGQSNWIINNPLYWIRISPLFVEYKVPKGFHKRSPLVSILSLMNPFHSLHHIFYVTLCYYLQIFQVLSSNWD
jgi:hypothetical protein